MKIAPFCLTALFVLSFAASSAKADYVLPVNTFDPAGWQVGKINVGDYVNPSANSVGTQWNDDFANWDAVNWMDAVSGSRPDWGSSDDRPGNPHQWVAMSNGDSSAKEVNKVDNGFYAFKYTLQASELNKYDTVTGHMELHFGADDYLAAVYATNGDNGRLNMESVGTGVQWLTLSNLDFEVDLTNGLLDLIFVIHNTNAGGSDSDNPMGLFIRGLVNTGDIKMDPYTPATSPEPATLLIFGAAAAGGLPFVLRRRRNRK